MWERETSYPSAEVQSVFSTASLTAGFYYQRLLFAFSTFFSMTHSLHIYIYIYILGLDKQWKHIETYYNNFQTPIKSSKICYFYGF